MSGHVFAGATALALFTSMFGLSRTEAPGARPQSSSVAFLQAPPGGGRGEAIQGNSGAEPCTKSPNCAWSRKRDLISHEVRTPNLGFTYAYPFALPEGGGGVAAVAINSKGHLFAFQ